MQTYTHLSIGAFFGLLLFPHQPLMEAAVVAGAIAPDLAMVIPFILDKAAGRQPLAKKSPLLKTLLLPSHSILVWLVLSAIGYIWWPILFAFALSGLLCHVAIDVFSHGDPKLNYGDSPYLWPISKMPLHLGTWDYRIRNGSLWPLRPLEGALLTAFILGDIALLILHGI